MKKLTIILTAIATLGLTACGPDINPKDQPNPPACNILKPNCG